MSEAIYIHRYFLRSRSALNSLASRTAHEGFLLRVGEGVGCVHPWVELGDPSLEALLESLKRGDRSPALLRNAFECARVDGEARRAGLSLFDGMSVPRSHATLVDREAQLSEAIAAGFTVAKIKAGRDLEEDAEWLNAAHASQPELRWRIDFNKSIDRRALDIFVSNLSASVLGSIDFFEDPCRDGESVDGLAVPLAIDHGVEHCDSPYSFAVIKPAVDEVALVCERARARGLEFLFTSYMDHPIGQSYAAYVAGCFAAEGGGNTECGLMTHGLFEATEFTEALGAVVPEWKPAVGTGLGFDALIENLRWERVR